jgi:hypothetical protein
MTGKPTTTRSIEHQGTEPAATGEPSAARTQARSIAAFCEAYSVGRTYVFEQIRIGALKAKKAGTRTLISHEEGERWYAALPSARREATRYAASVLAPARRN